MRWTLTWWKPRFDASDTMKFCSISSEPRLIRDQFRHQTLLCPGATITRSFEFLLILRLKQKFEQSSLQRLSNGHRPFVRHIEKRTVVAGEFNKLASELFCYDLGDLCVKPLFSSDLFPAGHNNSYTVFLNRLKVGEIMSDR
jgi:hypothetical protein